MPRQLVPAVGLIRMSSKKQDKSPAQQRAEILKHAERKGYRIIRWYTDEARSGGKEVHKRKDFLRLIDDAEELGDFRVIVAWDRSRYDRLDTIEGAEYKRRLRNADVILDTISDGEFDWNTEEGQLKDTFHSLKGKRDLITLSGNVIRGKLDALKERVRTHGGQPPYGMARQVTDDKGRVRRVPRLERMLTPDDWEVIYVEGDPEELAVVRWLFETFDRKDVSPYWLASDLNRRGIPSPRAARWRDMTVRSLLRDRAYVGDLVVGKKRTKQSFHRITKDGAKRNRGPDGRLAKGQKGDPSELVVYPGRWPAVIDAKLFARVQRKLDLNSDVGRKPRAADAGYPLSGILHCGHCGARLIGGRRKLKDGEIVRYNCGRFMNEPGTCIGAKIDQDDIYQKAVVTLVENVTPDRINNICVRRDDGPKGDPAAKLRARLAQLEKAIDNGTRRVNMVENDRVAAGILADLERLYEEKVEVEADLRALANPADVPALVTEWATRHRVPFWTGKYLARGRRMAVEGGGTVEVDVREWKSADRLEVRRAFLEVGLRIDVFWKERERRTREGKYQLDRCELSIDLNRLVTHRSTRPARSTAGRGSSGSTSVRSGSGRSSGP